MSLTSEAGASPGKIAGLFIGPCAALVLLAGPSWGWSLAADDPALNRVAAVAALMAIWWITEPVPIAATALLPLALFPLLEIMPGRAVAQEYGHDLIFLFLGGFLIALSLEECGLHRRMALSVIALMGDNPRRIVAGFMIAAAGLSMWISNTATAMMMLPIAASVLAQTGREDQRAAEAKRFGTALMLGVAYASSIGGLGTLIGSPPTIAFKAIYEEYFPQAPAIGFLSWMVMAIPFVVIFVALTWLMLVRWLNPVSSRSLLGGSGVIRSQLEALGPVTRAERRAGAIFLTTAILWITREPAEGYGWATWLGVDDWATDATPAVAMAILCFLIPSGTQRGKPLLTWEATKRVPWGILILFGGGLALAAGMGTAGLDAYLGRALAGAIGELPDVAKTAVVAFGMTWLTELTSNTASVQMICPVLAEAATELGIAPLALMVPAALAACCAFMLPVATPPNAIVYASGYLRIGDMIRAGFWLNMVAVALITLAVWLLGPVGLGREMMSGR